MMVKRVAENRAAVDEVKGGDGKGRSRGGKGEEDMRNRAIAGCAALRHAKDRERRDAFRTGRCKNSE
jgi:hypothetical protein